MQRKLRIEHEGTIYHVMIRGNRRLAIFLEDSDRELSLDVLERACGKGGRQVHPGV